MIYIIAAILQREFKITYRRGIASIYPLCFFILVAMLFALSTENDPQFLIRIGPGVIWVAALLACFLSLEQIFQQDHQTTCLEQWYLSGCPLALLATVKLAAQWLLTIGPLLLLIPIIAYGYGLSASVTQELVLSICLGTPILLFIGAIAAALTLNVAQQGLLLALLCLPLYIPVLIFGTAAVAEPSLLYILAALFLLTISIAPITLGAALKIGLA